ncbi:MAG: hypothetical protein CHH17_18155 [Candidatus Fluviicola riflensis]|nr:MAG: hypothetical protein CHH17_18155 [Candidatus Fluviicola riflensis]
MCLAIDSFTFNLYPSSEQNSYQSRSKSLCRNQLDQFGSIYLSCVYPAHFLLRGIHYQQYRFGIKSLYMGGAFRFFRNYVLLFLERSMESGNHITFIETLLPFAGIVFFIAVGVVLLTQQFRKNLYRQQLQQEELKNKHQLELLRSSIQVQEEERKRIAQDMHDELGATLSITRMHLLQAERLHGTDSERLLNDLQTVRTLTESSLESMRRISHELMPAQLEKFGLVKTLEAVAEQLNGTGKMDITLHASQDLSTLDQEIQLTLYRIFMELINNTLKHAGATQISIQLSLEDRVITGRYTDNGKGLNPETTGSGLGHKSIEGRISSVGGTITTGNNHLGSFQAVISVPLTHSR